MIDFAALVEEFRPTLVAINNQSNSPIPADQRAVAIDLGLHAAAEAMMAIERVASQSPNIGQAMAVRSIGWQIVNSLTGSGRDILRDVIREAKAATTGVSQ